MFLTDLLKNNPRAATINVISCNFNIMDSSTMDFIECELLTHVFKYQLEDLP